MEKKIVLLLHSIACDDMYGTTYHEVKICKSVDEAKKVVVSELNETLETKSVTIEGIVEEIKKDDPYFNIECETDDTGLRVWWEDSCKGDCFEIRQIDLLSEGWQELSTQQSF